MKSTTQRAIVVLLVLLALAGAAYYWWRYMNPTPTPALTSEPTPAEPPPVITAQPEAAPPSVEMPPPAQPLAQADIKPALSDLMGLKAVQTFFQLDEFPRKFVATVDNLGRSYAPPMAWPVVPAPGRFTVEKDSGPSAISAENFKRYTPLVSMAESVKPAAAIDVYIRMYPMLQQAYVELGYPKRQFNDRLLQVIDQLLATPAATEDMQVEVPIEVKGPMASSMRPWVRYEFSDPALRSLSSGQKILLRMGPDNERRIKSWLSGLRAEIRSRAKPQ